MTGQPLDGAARAMPERMARMREQVDEALKTVVPDTGAERRLLRAAVLFPRVEPLDWLAHMPEALRFYGATRDQSESLEIAGVGVADLIESSSPFSYVTLFDRLQEALDHASPDVRYYGGIRFAPTTLPDSDWTHFGVSRFIVPRFELIAHRDGAQLALHFTPREAASGDVDAFISQLAGMSFGPYAWRDSFPPPRTRSEHPDYAGWERHVQEALNAISSGELNKIVLARKADFTFDGTLDPIVLLHRLKSATPECFHFCYMPAPDIAFVGASPERLYLREGCDLVTEAIAGTRMRSPDASEDARLGRELLASDKDRREHNFVREGIRHALTSLSEHMAMDEEPSLLKLARGQHLYSGINARLHHDVSDADILERLHPTPALGGHPTERALQWIARLEPFDRGWYAAPVGWVSKEAAEFAVAIRSGLVQSHKLSLFSGAGLVTGSTAANEWDEIELKIRDFIKVLIDT